MRVEIAKIIRKKAKLNKWNMAKRMDRTIQSYIYLEEQQKNIGLVDLVRLADIAIGDCGMKIEEFWSLVVKEASKLEG